MAPFSEDLKPGHIKDLLFEIFRFLPRFILNPVATLNDLPTWEWPIILGLQLMMGLITGCLAGAVILEPLHVIGNGLLFPVQYVLMSLLGYGIVHMIVQPYLQVQMTRKETYLLTTLLLLPLMMFRIFSLTVIPVEIFGASIGLWLFDQTLIMRYRAPEARVRKLTWILAGVFAATWLLSNWTK
ncbi:MAG: hypothetical protein K2X47_07340 [Bdellovibrionales bacterium]|nr:hypothetical protein [Bdellovibrionales bacterium]